MRKKGKKNGHKSGQRTRKMDNNKCAKLRSKKKKKEAKGVSTESRHKTGEQQSGPQKYARKKSGQGKLSEERGTKYGQKE